VAQCIRLDAGWIKVKDQGQGCSVAAGTLFRGFLFGDYCLLNTLRNSQFKELPMGQSHQATFALYMYVLILREGKEG